MSADEVYLLDNLAYIVIVFFASVPSFVRELSGFI